MAQKTRSSTRLEALVEDAKAKARQQKEELEKKEQEATEVMDLMKG